MTDNINVFLKIKPEVEAGFTTINTTSVKIVSPSSFDEKIYNFRRVIKENQELEQQCLPIIDEAIRNQQNVCIIGYGQQKSGKSYALGFSLQNEGLLHSLLQHLFEIHAQQITLSMIQLYISQALDLLNQEKQSQELKIRIKNNEILIENLTEILASNYQESLSICEEGILRQQNTKLHTILTIKVSKSRIQFVEIAGSHAQASQGRSPEFPSQSNSTTSLFRVLASLRRNQTAGQQQFIPFRDSHLTMILKNQLLPPAKIILIGTIFPNNSVETNQTIKVIHSCHRSNENKARSVTPNKPKSTEKTIPKNENNIQLSQYKELSEYLLKLLTKINSHVCKLTNQECLKAIDINQNIDQIIQQVQQVSHQLLQTINSKLLVNTSETPSKIDGWQKAIKFLYHTYEDEMQREDKLLKEKLLYIINEDEQFDIDQLRKTLFPPKSEYTNSIYKTLNTLRKYTNSLQIPYHKENYRTKLLNDKEYTTGGNPSNGPKLELTSFQSYTENLMSKFKWQSTQKPDEFDIIQQ